MRSGVRADSLRAPGPRAREKTRPEDKNMSMRKKNIYAYVMYTWYLV